MADGRSVSDDLNGKLGESEGARRSLETQSAAERLERLKAALRLTRNWMKMSTDLRRQQDATIAFMVSAYRPAAFRAAACSASHVAFSPTPMSSTSKISVAPGGIEPPAPSSPYA